MMRLIMPIILIAISGVVFFTFSKPMYEEISGLRQKAASHNEALGNSKALENARDALTTKKNSIKPENLLKLEKLLPQNIDNIRLILEIEKIALPFGMVLKDVKYNTNDKEVAKNPATPGGSVVSAAAPVVTPATKKDYGVWELGFSTTGTYNNFINFVKDLESNLRIVDIASIQFSSASGTGGSAGGANTAEGSYKYDFKIKTYWLKN